MMMTEKFSGQNSQVCVSYIHKPTHLSMQQELFEGILLGSSGCYLYKCVDLYISLWICEKITQTIPNSWITDLRNWWPCYSGSEARHLFRLALNDLLAGLIADVKCLRRVYYCNHAQLSRTNLLSITDKANSSFLNHDKRATNTMQVFQCIFF